MATQAQVDRLAAGAQGGTAGVAAYEQAGHEVRAARNAAVGSLKSDLGGVDAPKALLGQLEGQLQTGANTQLGNLSSLGAASSFASQQNAQGTADYMKEADASLPFIRGEADKQLAQSLAQLAASRAGSKSGGGGGGAQLSDSELRNRLMGAATQLRQQTAADEGQRISANRSGPNPFSGYSSNEQLRAALLAAGNTEAAAAVPKDTMAQQIMGGYALSGTNIHPFQTSPDDRRAIALQNIKQQLYGPGISNVANLVAQQSGIPDVMARAPGLFGAQEDAAYVNANKSLGLYQDPNKSLGVNATIADPYTTGAALGLDRKMIDQYRNQHYFDWNGDDRLKGAFAAYVKAQAIDTTSQAALDQARKDFEKSPVGQGYTRPVVDDIVREARTAAEQGYSPEAYWAQLQTDPSFGPYQGEFTLAMAMAKPMFDYYQAIRQRQTASPDTSSQYAAPAPAGP